MDRVLGLLACPITGQGLVAADVALIDRINERIAARTLRTWAGEVVEEACEGGLVTADGAYFYPLRDGVQVLLEESAIGLADDRPGSV